MINFLKDSKAIIGMIHVEALPGTPKSKRNLADITAKAKAEALIYKGAGVDAISIENMHDVPYCKGRVGAEIVAAMAIVGHEVKQVTNMPCGVQILAGANIEALAVAHAAHLDFVRAEGFVFAHVADEGLIEGQAAQLLRYRRQIGAEDILILTDIKKKHSSHAITFDVDIAETAQAAEFFLSDGLVVTGRVTGRETDITELTLVKNAVDIPVIVGSGVNLDNVDLYLPLADALIVGSYFKRDGDWGRSVEFSRVKAFMDKVEALRAKE